MKSHKSKPIKQELKTISEAVERLSASLKRPQPAQAVRVTDVAQIERRK